MNEMKRNEDIEELINDFKFDQIELSENRFEDSVFSKIDKHRFDKIYRRRLMQLAASIILILNIGIWWPSSSDDERSGTGIETDYFNEYGIDIYASNDQIEENE